jgi:hypothetical protein
MLGQHPEMVSFPELNLFVAETLDAVFLYMEAHATPRLLTGTLRALAQLHEGRQTVEAVNAAYAWLHDRRNWPVKRVLDHILAEIHPRIGVDKSPCTTFPSFLARAHRLYPHARFLHLTRHPRTALESLRNVIAPATSQIEERAALRGAALFWLIAHGTIVSFTSRLRPEQVLRLRGEDLLSNPAAALPRVCRWLGIDTSPDTIEAMMHPERSPFARPGPENARLGGDPAFLASPALRPATLPLSTELPARWGLDPRMTDGVRALAERLGYGSGDR